MKEVAMARRAVLVGVDNYARPEVPDLNGCVNDVTLMRGVLKSYFGFGNDDIRMLVNDRAMKAAIVHRLEEMVGQAREGDHLVFHFSGHGSQIRDRNHDESLSDHLDELICPHDMNWNNGYITDDDLEQIFHGLHEGVLLEVILDCCHSGTGVKGLEIGRPAGLEARQARVRFVAPPVDIAARADGDDDLKTVTFCSCLRKRGQPYVFWAAAAEDEIAAEDNLGGAINGVFTYYLCSYLEATAGQTSREELLAAVSEVMQTAGYAQHPQLRSEEDGELVSEPLGGEAFRPVWTPFDL
jgi:metacaspase-1